MTRREERDRRAPDARVGVVGGRREDVDDVGGVVLGDRRERDEAGRGVGVPGRLAKHAERRSGRDVRERDERGPPHVGVGRARGCGEDVEGGVAPKAREGLDGDDPNLPRRVPDERADGVDEARVADPRDRLAGVVADPGVLVGEERSEPRDDRGRCGDSPERARRSGSRTGGVMSREREHLLERARVLEERKARDRGVANPTVFAPCGLEQGLERRRISEVGDDPNGSAAHPRRLGARSGERQPFGLGTTERLDRRDGGVRGEVIGIGEDGKKAIDDRRVTHRGERVAGEDADRRAVVGEASKGSVARDPAAADEREELGADLAFVPWIHERLRERGLGRRAQAAERFARCRGGRGLGADHFDERLDRALAPEPADEPRQRALLPGVGAGEEREQPARDHGRRVDGRDEIGANALLRDRSHAIVDLDDRRGGCPGRCVVGLGEEARERRDGTDVARPTEPARGVDRVARVTEERDERRDRARVSAPPERVDRGEASKKIADAYGFDERVDDGFTPDPPERLDRREADVVVRVHGQAGNAFDGSDAPTAPEDLKRIADDRGILVLGEGEERRIGRGPRERQRVDRRGEPRLVATLRRDQLGEGIDGGLAEVGE